MNQFVVAAAYIMSLNQISQISRITWTIRRDTNHIHDVPSRSEQTHVTELLQFSFPSFTSAADGTCAALHIDKMLS